MTKSINSLLHVRRSTLATAAALAMGAAAPAMADMADSGYYRFGQYDGSADQTLSLNNYALWITSPQLNTGFVSATAAGVSYQAYLSGSAGMGTPVTQAGNSIAATAGANQSTSGIDLAVMPVAGEGSDGAAIMTGQVRRDAATQALVAGSGVAIRLDGMPVANQVISGNTLAASTTLNQSASTIEGVLPAGTAPGRPAQVSSMLELSGNGIQTFSEPGLSGLTAESRSTAGAAITTAQVSSNAGYRAGSSATLAGSSVTLAATQGGWEGQGQVAAQLAITGNDLSAQYHGNRASSQFNGQAGSAASVGSVVVSNLQANVENSGYGMFNESGPAATARVADTSVRADLRSGDSEGYGYGYGMRTELTGSLAITGNSVLASSTGNSATARDGAGAAFAGNSIVLGGSADTAGGQSYGSSMAGASGASAGNEVRADLALSNVQGNSDTAFVSEVSRTTVSARVDHVAASGSVALNGNGIAATATGNAAGNRVQADASRISATAAASSTQANTWTDVVAGNIGSRIEAGIGAIGRDASGATSLSANRLSASATGNVADTRVALSATHLATGGSMAFASAATWEGGFGGASADATALNAQSNQGGAVMAVLAGGRIEATFADQWYGEGLPVGLQGAAVSLKDNALRSQALGNDAATGVSLSATTASTSAAVASRQSNSAWLRSELSDGGVTLAAGNVFASSLVLDNNLLASSATANRADNQLVATLGRLGSGGEQVGFGLSAMGLGGANSANRQDGSAVAGFAVVNAQSNDGPIEARNVAEGPMVRASVGSGYSGHEPIPFGGIGGQTGAAGPSVSAFSNDYARPALAASTVSVTGNTASAASTANQAANTLSLGADSVATRGGFGAPLAAVNSVQSGWNDSRSRAVAGGQGGGLLMGVQFEGEVAGSTVSVTGNTVSASNLGNTVANRLEAAGTSDVPANGGQALRGLRADSFSASVQNDFSLVNLQSDSGAGRSATTRQVAVGIEDNSSWTPWSGVVDSTLAVAGNRNLAEARNNNAVNGISLGGFSALGAGAGLANGQDSSGRVSADAQGRFRIRARDSGIESSTLALTDNVTQALAVANSADNSIAARATTLQGAVSWFGAGDVFDGGYGVASAAGFALGNAQSHEGRVDATASNSSRINLDASGVFGSTASVTGNVVGAVAQANSANNALELAATTVNGVTGAVNSAQSASGRVSATAAAPTEDGAFFVRGQALFDSQATVSNNAMRAAAGQNEAFNQQTVAGSAMNAAFSVSSQQQGSGNVDASAMPARIGVMADGVFGGNLAVTGNQVAARANVNTASNALTLAAGSAAGTSGAVSNQQATGNGGVTATVGSFDSATIVGAMPSALNGTAVSVTGNTLAAQAGGNTGANVLNASGAAAANGGANFAVLNSQSNAAAMNAAVRNATVGVAMNGYGYEGTGMNSASASVLANSVTASGYGNTASNAIGLGLQTAAGGGATASLASRQTNTAAIGAIVSNVTIGITGANANGSSGVVSGNSVSAQAIGNSVVNAISAK